MYIIVKFALRVVDLIEISLKFNPGPCMAHIWAGWDGHLCIGTFVLGEKTGLS